jgi:hypothetical protein
MHPVVVLEAVDSVTVVVETEAVVIEEVDEAQDAEETNLKRKNGSRSQNWGD